MKKQSNLPEIHNNTIDQAIIEMVKTPDIQPERLEKFIDLKFKIEAEQAKQAFQNAMANFQGECPIIKKSKKVKFTGKSGNTTAYNYAPLDEMVYIIKPIMQKHGLSFSFNIKRCEDGSINELITTIRHSRGHSENYSHWFNPLHDNSRMNQSQRIKSALSFAKRAGLENALGIVTAEEDDDARRAIDTPITEEQLKEIESLINSTQTDYKVFMEFLKVDNLDLLSDFEARKAIYALRKKRVVEAGKGEMSND